MISNKDVDRISIGWITEFSVDPYVLKRRDMVFWHELDHLVYRAPPDALRVFERIAQKKPINWTIEGLAVGPLRTFLMLHSGKFENELVRLRHQEPIFDDMYQMAKQGL